MRSFNERGEIMKTATMTEIRRSPGAILNGEGPTIITRRGQVAGVVMPPDQIAAIMIQMARPVQSVGHGQRVPVSRSERRAKQSAAAWFGPLRCGA